MERVLQETQRTVRVAGKDVFFAEAGSGPPVVLLRTLWRMDFTRDRRLSSLRTPTLVIWGTEDKVNRPSGAAVLAERMPNCEVLMVREAGHWVQWERAELFNDAVRSFLSGGAR
jgi:pimeloyl-ACP methyl ester carboxylesterase